MVHVKCVRCGRGDGRGGSALGSWRRGGCVGVFALVCDRDEDSIFVCVVVTKLLLKSATSI